MDSAARARAYANELSGLTLTAADLSSQPRMIERITYWLKAKGITLLKDGGFNHYLVAQAVLPTLTTTALQPKELARFDQLFDRVASAF